MRLDRRPAPAGARLLLAALLAAGALSCGRGGEPAHWICVSNERSGTVTVIDGATRSTLATIRLGKRPRGIHAAPDGRTLYVALSGSPIAGPPGSTPEPLPPADRSADGIGVVDLRALVLTRTFRAGVDPEQFAIAPDGSILYVANEDAATLSLVRAADGRIERVVPMGDEPEGVGVAPGGREVVATCEGYGDVFILDAAGIPLARDSRHPDAGGPAPPQGRHHVRPSRRLAADGDGHGGGRKDPLRDQRPGGNGVGGRSPLAPGPGQRPGGTAAVGSGTLAGRPVALRRERPLERRLGRRHPHAEGSGANPRGSGNVGHRGGPRAAVAAAPFLVAPAAAAPPSLAAPVAAAPPF
jgi:YVTN family beta-propeller protein